MMKRWLGILVLAGMFSQAVFAGDWDITVFRPAVNPRNKKDCMVMAAEQYKKETGGKVTFILADWGQITTRIVGNLAAGTPIDVFWAGADHFPRFYTKQYVQPLDGWVNLDTPNLNRSIMDRYFKFDGKTYVASNKGSNHTRIVMFNKSLMEEEGIKASQMPDALYKAGKWDFAALRDLAMRLTKDTDGDGKTDRWGFGGYDYSMFVYGNGATFTTVDAKGQYRLNYDDPRLAEGLNYLAQAYTQGWFQPDNAIAATGLQRRTVAMYIEGSWFTESVQKETKDRIIAVPIPLGPGNKDKTYPFTADGYSMGAGSKKQKAAGRYIEICCNVWNDYDQALIKTREKYIGDFLEEIGKKQVLISGTTAVIEPIASQVLGSIAWGGVDTRQILEATRPLAQSAVEDANYREEKPVQLPFKEILVDFENGDLSAFQSAPGKTDFQLIGDGKAIKGKSLLIKAGSKASGKVCGFVSDVRKLGLPGYRNYLLSFDLRLLEAPGGAETVVSLELAQGSRRYGLVQQKINLDGQVVSVTQTFKDVFRNGLFALELQCEPGVTLVVDNLKIKEIK